MLSIARRAFSPVPYTDTLRISRPNFETDLSIGLRLILDQISHSASPSPNANLAVNVVLKKPNIPIPSIPTPKISDETESGFACFLKSCHLCEKRLKADDDIYMYMGDQGFCSVECRSKKMAIDEMKEVEEALDRRVLAKSSPPPPPFDAGLPECPEGGNCETCRLLEDLRQRRLQRKQARR